MQMFLSVFAIGLLLFTQYPLLAKAEIAQTTKDEKPSTQSGFQKLEEFEKDQEKKANETTDSAKDAAEDKASSEAPAQVQKKLSSYTGEIFTIRSLNRTEVFFRNNNQSYFIPKGPKHNTLLKELQKKAKASSVVTIDFDEKTHEIQELKEPVTTLAAPKVSTPSTGASPSGSESNK